MLSRRTHIIRIINLHHICILMCPLFLLFSCHRTPKEEKLTLLFTGDVLLDRGIRPLIERYGIRELFKGVEQEFRRADAVIINLECPLTRRITPLNKQFIFRAEPEWAKGLRWPTTIPTTKDGKDCLTPTAHSEPQVSSL